MALRCSSFFWISLSLSCFNIFISSFFSSFSRNLRSLTSSLFSLRLVSGLLREFAIVLGYLFIYVGKCGIVNLTFYRMNRKWNYKFLIRFFESEIIFMLEFCLFFHRLFIRTKIIVRIVYYFVIWGDVTWIFFRFVPNIYSTVMLTFRAVVLKLFNYRLFKKKSRRNFSFSSKCGFVQYSFSGAKIAFVSVLLISSLLPFSHSLYSSSSFCWKAVNISLEVLLYDNMSYLLGVGLFTDFQQISFIIRIFEQVLKALF